MRPPKSMVEDVQSRPYDVLNSDGAKEIIKKSMDSYDVHYCGKYED